MIWVIRNLFFISIIPILLFPDGVAISAIFTLMIGHVVGKIGSFIRTAYKKNFGF